MGALKLSMKDVTVEKAENLVDQIQEVMSEGDQKEIARIGHVDHLFWVGDSGTI